MVVVVHQAVGVAQPGEAPDDMLEEAEEMLPIGVVVNDPAARVAACNQVVDASGNADPQRAGHEPSVETPALQPKPAGRVVTLSSRLTWPAQPARSDEMQDLTPGS